MQKSFSRSTAGINKEPAVFGSARRTDAVPARCKSGDAGAARKIGSETPGLRRTYLMADSVVAISARPIASTPLLIE